MTTKARRGEQRLSAGRKIGTAVLAALYAGIALVASVVGASSEVGGNSGSAAEWQGYVVGYFGCCASIPVFVATVVALIVNRGGKDGDFLGRFVSIVFWVLLVLMPFQIVSLLLAVARILGAGAHS